MQLFSEKINKSKGLKMTKVTFQIHFNFFLDIEKTKKGFYPKRIVDKHGEIVCFSTTIYFFLELLSSFVANQLNPDKTYKLVYDDFGFWAKVVRKNKIHYLRIDVGENSYYLEKYDCKVIYSYAKSILAKCTYKEFLE